MQPPLTDMLRAIAFVICTILASTVFGQECTLYGTVTIAGEPVEFATVQIKGTSTGTETNLDGSFEIKGLAEGEYTLVASFVGYMTQNRVVTLTSGERIEVNFELKPSAIIDEVVVTGTMRPTYTLDSPVKVESISAKQLETYMPSAASSVVEAVNLVNGVQEVVSCGVCFTNSISINGLDGAYTAVLIDGMPVYGNLASVYGLNGIPNMIIDRIEVIKGPSSTLYGSEAVAGVINILTKNPEDQPLLSVDLMGTTHKELFGNLAIAPRIGKSTGYVGFNYGLMTDFEDWNQDGFNDGVNLDRYSLFTKWNIHRESGKLFSLAGKYYYEDRRNGVRDYLKNRAYRELRGSESVYGESIYTNRAELFGSYELEYCTLPPPRFFILASPAGQLLRQQLLQGIPIDCLRQLHLFRRIR